VRPSYGDFGAAFHTLHQGWRQNAVGSRGLPLEAISAYCIEESPSILAVVASFLSATDLSPPYAEALPMTALKDEPPDGM